MARPTTLTDPWLSLARKLGGAEALYASIEAEIGCSKTTAKRICRDIGQLTFSEWCMVAKIFRRHRLLIVKLRGQYE